jgi:hypothetical protein
VHYQQNKGADQVVAAITIPPNKTPAFVSIDPEALGSDGERLRQATDEILRHGTQLLDPYLEEGRGADRAAIDESLDAISLLPHGWDSYSAPAPSVVAVRHAKVLVKEADQFGMLPARVEPSVMGGVGVTFSSGNREAVIEFYNKGSAHALFTDEVAGDMRTEPISTDLAGYQKFLIEVRTYLDDK